MSRTGFDGGTGFGGSPRRCYDDFPANLENLAIRHIGLYFARAEGETNEIEIESLTFKQNGTTVTSSPITSDVGIISTRRANAGSLGGVIGLEPVGEWKLSLQLRERGEGRGDPEAVQGRRDR